MCLENLPIEFDEAGNARLKEGVANPYSYVTQTVEEREAFLTEIARKNGQINDVDFDPVTRVAGALAFHSTVNLKDRKVVDTASMATLFRGYEVILRGRDPRDAGHLPVGCAQLSDADGCRPGGLGDRNAGWHRDHRVRLLIRCGDPLGPDAASR